MKHSGSKVEIILQPNQICDPISHLTPQKLNIFLILLLIDLPNDAEIMIRADIDHAAAHHRPRDGGHVCSRNQRVTHCESQELRGDVGSSGCEKM